MTKAERTSRQRALILDSGVLVVGGGSPTPETRLAGCASSQSFANGLRCWARKIRPALAA